MSETETQDIKYTIKEIDYRPPYVDHGGTVSGYHIVSTMTSPIMVMNAQGEILTISPNKIDEKVFIVEQEFKIKKLSYTIEEDSKMGLNGSVKCPEVTLTAHQLHFGPVYIEEFDLMVFQPEYIDIVKHPNSPASIMEMVENTSQNRPSNIILYCYGKNPVQDHFFIKLFNTIIRVPVFKLGNNDVLHMKMSMFVQGHKVSTLNPIIIEDSSGVIRFEDGYVVPYGMTAEELDKAVTVMKRTERKMYTAQHFKEEVDKQTASLQNQIAALKTQLREERSVMNSKLKLAKTELEEVKAEHEAVKRELERLREDDKRQLEYVKHDVDKHRFTAETRTSSAKETAAWIGVATGVLGLGLLTYKILA